MVGCLPAPLKELTAPHLPTRWLDKDKDDGQLVRELLPSDSNATLKSKLFCDQVLAGPGRDRRPPLATQKQTLEKAHAPHFIGTGRVERKGLQGRIWKSVCLCCAHKLFVALGMGP